MKTIVYTVNFNSYDNVYEPVIDEGYEYLYFTDNPFPRRIWTVVPAYTIQDPKRACNYRKINSHLLPDHDVSLWIDASLRPLASLGPLIDQFVQSGFDLGICKHRWRGCVYKEAEACLKRKLDDPQVIHNHMQRYRDEGFPENYGMLETTFILRRNTDQVRRFNEIWHREYVNGSRRDQLSVMYALKESGIQEVMGIPFTVARNPYFEKTKHRKTCASS